MMHSPTPCSARHHRVHRYPGKRPGFLLAATIVVFCLLLGPAAGMAEDTTSLQTTQVTPDDKTAQLPDTATARVTRIMETYAAVGTVTPLSEISIESQVGAQVTTVHVQAGDRVKKGERLITLDNRQASARLDRARQALKQAEANKQEARQGVTAARAVFKAAELHYNRIKTYYESQAATRQELEKAESGFVQAKAGVARAMQALTAAEAGIRQAAQTVSETRVGLGFSHIDAPENGEVIKRMVEPGDMALPGRPLMQLRTEAGFQLAAHVREGLIHKIKKEMVLTAEITSLGATCKARVTEIIPYADPATRTFLVKAALPPVEGLYPGMYGKLFIPESEREVVQIPAAALIRTGQLEQVLVRENNGWQRIYVTSGHCRGKLVEILSGLDDGDVVKLNREGRP